MINLKDSQIAQILPECLAERTEVQALSYAVHRSMERLVGYCGNIGVFSAIDIVPEYVLDMLAMELGTQYYDDSMAINAKRSLVKNTLVWYMKAGTPGAVEELVAASFGEGEVKEWFEYGGKPYFFKVIVDADKVNKNNMGEFVRMISAVKNTRSHMESIGMKSDIDNKILNDMRLVRVCFYIKVPFCPFRSYDGTMRYDGSASYDAKRKYKLGTGLRIHCGISGPKEEICNMAIESRRNVQYYDGKMRYDGKTKYNAMIRKDVIE